MTTAAIVLAGGRSTRMGTPKAALEWHGSTLLRRVAGIAARAVDGPVLVVRAPGQELPALPAGIELAEDAEEGRGPLAALAIGLATIGDRAEVVYLTGVDVPFLHPVFIGRVLALLGPMDDIAIPRTHGFAQPLAAVYRTATVASQLRKLLAADPEPGSRALLRRCRVTELDEAVLLADPDVAVLDPTLQSLHNLNAPPDYAQARRRPAPTIALRVDGGRPQAHEAATLLAAVSAAGRTLDAAHVTVNGHRATDPEEPLVAGDLVALNAARA